MRGAVALSALLGLVLLIMVRLLGLGPEAISCGERGDGGSSAKEEGPTSVAEAGDFVDEGELESSTLEKRSDSSSAFRHGGCGALPAVREPDGGTPSPGGREADEPAGGSGRVTTDGVHSPVTESVVASLEEIAAKGPDKRDDVLVKVGDSHSVGVTFLGCFVRSDPDLGAHEHLRATLEHFSGSTVDGESSLRRESVAAVAGIGSGGLSRGDPSPLREEIDAAKPRFALVMVGTNDVGWRTVDSFAADLERIIDELSEEGIVPLMSTIPPIADEEKEADVLRYNEAIVELAVSRSLPLVDLFAALQDLPEMGLRDDGVHLSVDWRRGGGMAACHMDEDGLAFGANVRNLVTLQQLDRARRALLEGEVLDSE